MSTDRSQTTPKPCPFCGSEMLHIESWAKSFQPARLYHEYHHPPEADCYLRYKREYFNDDVAAMATWIERWNRRVS